MHWKGSARWLFQGTIQSFLSEILKKDKRNEDDFSETLKKIGTDVTNINICNSIILFRNKTKLREQEITERTVCNGRVVVE